MTPEEEKALQEIIDKNRAALEEVRINQLRDREARTFVLDEPEDVPDDALSTRKYEPQDAAQATEIE